MLVLEDEANIRSFVVINLKRAGYETIEAGTGEEALAQLRRNPDIKVALLDIMLPDDMDGFEVCRRIRASDSKIGIIMLTARTQEMDKVTGLMTGADDYVTKPFSPAELTARVDALFRRAGGEEPVQSGEIRQDIPEEMLFRLVFGPVRLLVKQWGLSGGAFDLRRKGEELIDVLRKLLAPCG